MEAGDRLAAAQCVLCHDVIAVHDEHEAVPDKVIDLLTRDHRVSFHGEARIPSQRQGD